MHANDSTSFRWIQGSLVAVATLALGACVDTDAGTDEPIDTDTVEAAVMTGGGSQNLDVFILDNSATRNAVVGFHRDKATGLLARVAAFPTGGKGTAAGLGSQGSIALDPDGGHLFAVNPGSDEVSVFEVRGSALILRDLIDSGGANPISVTVDGDLLYVLNAGRGATAGSIAGFRLGDESTTPIAGSIRPLSGAAVGPAQIQFTPAGDVLVVTEKATNNLTTYLVDASGAAGAPIVTPASGQTPFGFAFDQNGYLIVSEAFGGMPGLSAVSSYAVGANGVPSVISASVPDNQTAACWVAIGASRTAYTANFGSATVSGYRVKATGELTAFADGGVTGTTAAGPADADFNATGSILYVHDTTGDMIDIFRRESTGALTPIGRVGGLPATAVGMAAR